MSAYRASDKGLADHLISNKPVSDLIMWTGFETLTLIPGGKTAQGDSELVEPPRMKETRPGHKNRYVFSDLRAALDSADALAPAPWWTASPW